MNEVEKTRKISEIVAKWWTGVIISPRFDTGDDSKVGFFIQFLQESLVTKLNPHQLKQFSNEVYNYVYTTLQKCSEYEKFYLDVDYNPCKVLSQIAEKCDISLNNFPLKTTMCITKHSINVKYGYGSMYETLYADKQYYDREIEHYQETLDEYTNGKDKDFVVGTKQELIEGILEKIKQLECNRLNADD